jgi:hypothetical protein
VNAKGTVAVSIGRSWACTATETPANSKTVVIMVRRYFMGFSPFQSAGESGYGSHIALAQPSAQCSASGLHLCPLCSAKYLKM